MRGDHEHGIGARQTKADPGGAFVAEPGFGEHCIFLQIGLLRLDQLARHGQQVAVFHRDDAKARQHAALGRASGAKAGLAGTEVIEIAGHLALQELGCVRAAYCEQAFVIEECEVSAIGHGANRITE